MATIPGAAGPGAGFPQWTYNTQSHAVSRVDNAAAKAGAIAVAFPFKLIFFTSQAAADAYMKSQGGGADISGSPATGAANALGSAAQTIAGTTGASEAACAVSVPLIGCILTKTQARALIGGTLIAGGLIVGAVGMLLLAAEGFRRSGAGTALNRTGSTLGKVPGLKAAGTAVKAAGRSSPSRAVPGVKGGKNPPASEGGKSAVKKPAPAAPAAKQRVGGSQVSPEFRDRYMRGAG